MIILLALFGCTTNKGSTIEQTSLYSDEIQTLFEDFYLKNEDYVCRERELDSVSSEACSVQDYYKDDELKVVKIVVYSEMGKTEINYFIIKKDFIYVVENNVEYTKPITESFEIKSKNLERYYIK